MAKKKRLTALGVVVLAFIFLLCSIPVASAEITASIRLNGSEFQQGDPVPVWITLDVTQDVVTDDHMFWKKFEWLLDVRDAFGNRLRPIEGVHTFSQPLPPDKKLVTLKADQSPYEVIVPNLWDYYWPADGGPVPFGVYSVQFVMSMTEYVGEVANERVVESNIEKFKIYTDAEVGIEVHPDPMRLASLPNWATCYVTNFPDDYGPADVDVDSCTLCNGDGECVSPSWADIQGEDTLMVKFPGSETGDLVSTPRVTLYFTGWLGEYIRISGEDTIKVK